MLRREESRQAETYESGGKPHFDSAQDKPHSKWGSTELPQILSLRGLTLFRFLHRGFGTDETDLGMLAIAEGLVQTTAATAKRESRLAGEVEFIARGVHQLNGSFRSFHSIWAVWTNRDFH